MNYIEINKSLVPYTFEILLGQELFAFRVDYNNTGDLFTLSLSKNDEVLCSGEPIIYGVPLFENFKTRGNFPTVKITPVDESGDMCAVTFDNLSSTVFLKVTEGNTDE